VANEQEESMMSTNTNPFDGTDQSQMLAEGTSAVVKTARFSRRAKIIAGIVAATVAIGGGAAYAMFNTSNLNLYVSLGNWVNSGVADVAISLQVSPDAMKRGGTTDAEVKKMNLPGLTTVEDLATALGQTRIHVQSTSGGKGVGLDKSNIALALQYGSNNVIDLRVIDRMLYLSTGIKELPNVTPQVITQQKIDDVTTSINQYAGFLGKDSFAVKLVNTLLSGQFASASLKKGTYFGDQLDKTLSSATAQPLPTDSSTSKAQQSIIDALKNSSSVTSDGSDSTGNRFLLTLNLQKFGKEMVQKIKTTDLGSLETYRTQIENSLSNLSLKATNQKLEARMWADSGTLKRMDLDLSQIINLSNSGATLKDWDVTLRMDIGESAPSAPSNSVDFTSDIDALMTSLQSLGLS
jgi:hypothetical protein